MSPRTIKPGFIPIPKNLSYPKFKIEIIAQSDSQTHDLTEYVLRGHVNKRSTTSLSNFSIEVDNGGGIWKGKFQAGDVVNIYYEYTTGSLTTIRYKGKVDGAFNNLSSEQGYFLTIEGRDFPEYSDINITISFATANVLDVFRGSSGTSDSQSNLANGLLYNSGLTLKVYDTSTSTWVIYKDLSDAQRVSLKAQSYYTDTITDSFEDKSRLFISAQVASETDITWRVHYDPSDSTWYLMVHPENLIKNDDERAIVGQNIIGVTRYGKDTKKESNRIKIIGETDSNLVMFRTKEDTARQSSLWIKDFVQQVTELNTNSLVESRANATLNTMKEETDTGGIRTPGMITLQAGEKIHLSIPYIHTGDILVDSFVINFGSGVGLENSLNVKEREQDFADIFKRIINDQTNIISTNNPNSMTNGIQYDFSDPDQWSLVTATIDNEILNGTGTATSPLHTADNNITEFELRVSATNILSCTYRVSNDGGFTFEDYTIGSVHTFSSTGNELLVEMTLAGSPEYDKVNFLYKT